MPTVIKKAQHFAPGTPGLKVIRISNHGSGSDPHSHEFEELVVVTGGHGLHRVEGQEYEIGRGDVFLILGNTAHCYPKAEGLELINILFDPPSLRLPLHDLGGVSGYVALFQLEPLLRRQRAFKNRLRLEGASLRELLGLVGQLEAELNSTATGRFFAGASIWMQIQLTLSRRYTEEAHDGGVSLSGLSRVVSHMERHAAEPQTVEQLAQVAGMSVSAFFREFKAVIGCPPIEHLLRIRIRKARRLLQTTRMRVAEVAAAAGFEDSNYFTRQFRRLTGSSPLAYRKLHALPQSGLR